MSPTKLAPDMLEAKNEKPIRYQGSVRPARK
jgi:hypothetical protein